MPFLGSPGPRRTWTSSLIRSCPTETSWTPTTPASPTPSTARGESSSPTSPSTTSSELHFHATYPNPRTYVRELTNGAARIFFLPPNAATGNWTHVSRVAPPGGTFKGRSTDRATLPRQEWVAGFSTAVENTPSNQKVMGLNPPIFHFPSSQ